MFRQPNPEVLVVGAGPVGLVAALCLQQRGVRVDVVDMHQRTTQHSYALAVHPSTLRILDETGLSEGLIAAGRALTQVAFYEGPERRAAIDYSALASHPYLLVLRQSLLERAAEEALRRAKQDVLWGHRLQSLSADDNKPRAEVAQLDQVATGYPVARTEWLVVRTEAIRPAYVIGADGYDSAVRRMAGLELEEYGPGQIFSVYEIEAAGELPAEVRVILDPDLTSVYWPLEEGRCRWGFQNPGRLGTRGVNGAARAARCRESSLVDGAADADLLVHAGRLRETPDAELRQGRRLARGRRGAPGGPGRGAQPERGIGGGTRAGRAHRADPAGRRNGCAPPGVRSRCARDLAAAARRRG